MYGTEILYLAKEPQNRRQRKQMEKEVKGVWGRLTEVETKFTEDLFSLDVEYTDLYNHYVLQFKAICDWIAHNKKHEWVLINTKYIVDNFKPVESVEGGWNPIQKIRLCDSPVGFDVSKVEFVDC